MRNITIYILLSAFFLIKCNGSNAKKQDNPEAKGTSEIVFTEYEYNFGKVTEGEKVSHQFVFENKGKGDLIINSVSTSCGCTVPKYTSEPIKSGNKGNIEVLFDALDKNGKQSKTVTVNTNATVPVILLRITAEVEQK